MLAKCFLFFVLAAHCFLATVIAAAPPPPPQQPENGDKQMFNEVNTRCKEEYNLDQEEIARLNKTRPLETVDDNIKCFVKCLMTGMKLMNEEGEFTLDDAEERNLKFKKHFGACRDVTGENPCDKALNFQNCLWAQADLEE